MNDKYQTALDNIVDLAEQYDFEEIPGSNYPQYYFSGDTFMSEFALQQDIATLQKLVNLTNKYSVEQIKSILEAWEVVNTDFKICFDEEEEGYEGYFITGKDYYGKNSAIFSYIKSHYQIIKKASEETNEKIFINH